MRFGGEAIVILGGFGQMDLTLAGIFFMWPFSGCGRVKNGLADSFGHEAWPGGILVVVDGFDPCGWWQTECTPVEELDDFGF